MKSVSLLPQLPNRMVGAVPTGATKRPVVKKKFQTHFETIKCILLF